MSRYAELTKTLWLARRDSLLYSQEYEAFASHLIGGLVTMLEVPPDCFQYLPIDSEADKATWYSIAAASDFDDDNWFHVRFQIRLRMEPNPLPVQPVNFRFRIRREGQVWLVKMFEQAAAHRIRSLDADLPQFVDVFTRELQSALAQTLRDVIENPTPTPQIGFHLPEFEE